MANFIGKTFNGPCIVSLTLSGNYEPSRFYGPFENLKQCEIWMDIQFDQGFKGAFAIEPIRTPYRVRTNSDWWMRDDIRKDEDYAADFPDKTWFSIKNWRKFLKRSGRIKIMQRRVIRNDFDYENPFEYIDWDENARLYGNTNN